MASVIEVFQLTENLGLHQSVLDAHQLLPSGQCGGCGQAGPCLWAATATAGVAECELRIAAVNAELGRVASLALPPVLRVAPPRRRHPLRLWPRPARPSADCVV